MAEKKQRKRSKRVASGLMRALVFANVSLKEVASATGKKEETVGRWMADGAKTGTMELAHLKVLKMQRVDKLTIPGDWGTLLSLATTRWVAQTGDRNISNMAKTLGIAHDRLYSGIGDKEKAAKYCSPYSVTKNLEMLKTLEGQKLLTEEETQQFRVRLHNVKNRMRSRRPAAAASSAPVEEPTVYRGLSGALMDEVRALREEVRAVNAKLDKVVSELM